MLLSTFSQSNKSDSKLVHEIYVMEGFAKELTNHEFDLHFEKQTPVEAAYLGRVDLEKGYDYGDRKGMDQSSYSKGDVVKTVLQSKGIEDGGKQVTFAVTGVELGVDKVTAIEFECKGKFFKVTWFVGFKLLTGAPLFDKLMKKHAVTPPEQSLDNMSTPYSAEFVEQHGLDSTIPQKPKKSF